MSKKINPTFISKVAKDVNQNTRPAISRLKQVMQKPLASPSDSFVKANDRVRYDFGSVGTDSFISLTKLAPKK